MNACPLAEWLAARPTNLLTRGSGPYWKRMPYTLDKLVRFKRPPGPPQGITKRKLKP
jgi:hypothetical protein